MAPEVRTTLAGNLCEGISGTFATFAAPTPTAIPGALPIAARAQTRAAWSCPPAGNSCLART